eukprot:253076_1
MHSYRSGRLGRCIRHKPAKPYFWQISKPPHRSYNWHKKPYDEIWPDKKKNVFGGIPKTRDDIAEKKLFYNAERMMFEHEEKTSELVESIRKRLIAVQDGEDVDDAEIEKLKEALDERLLDKPPDIEEFKRNVRAEWKKNPELKEKMLGDMEERRQTLSKYSWKRGEPTIQSPSMSLYNNEDSHKYDNLPGRLSATDPATFRPEYDYRTRLGVDWPITPPEIENRWRDLPPPARGEETIKLTVVDAMGKVHKDCEMYIGESFTRSLIRNQIPILAECHDSDQPERASFVGEYGKGAMCVTCQVRLEKDLYMKTIPGDEYERHLLRDCVTSTKYDRLACLIYVRKDMDGMRLYIPPVTKSDYNIYEF